MPERYYIPVNLDKWKWPRHINSNYTEVKAASSEWLRSFGAFSPKAQEAYDRCDVDRLAALAYPLQDKVGLRSGCDLINVLFVFDEYTDVAREEEVQVMANIGMDALRNPHKPRPKDEWVGGEITRQFWELAIKTASAQAQKRFIETFDAFLQAVAQEAADRAQKHIRNIQDYLAIRRDTTALRPCFAVLEFDMNLPDKAVRHPVIEELCILTIDMILLTNDIASYNLEQARGGDNHNIITTVMHHNKTDIQGAMNWAYDYHKELEAKFMDLYENKIPKFGEPVDIELAQYVEGLGNWVRANDQWGFESERYFGKKGPEIERTRCVTLLPKGRSEDIGPQLVDDFLL
ncbi:terpenoid synthase [Lactarius vividus]|nr:terpenoid synthase [Lactarius vividus]